LNTEEAGAGSRDTDEGAGGAPRTMLAELTDALRVIAENENIPRERQERRRTMRPILKRSILGLVCQVVA